jgi:hypothetical protein
MSAELGEIIQEEHAVVAQRQLTRHQHLPPPVRATSEIISWAT